MQRFKKLTELYEQNPKVNYAKQVVMRKEEYNSNENKLSYYNSLFMQLKGINKVYSFISK
jgi:hypothetical protein